MPIRSDEELPQYIKEAIVGRFTASELIELLNIDIEDIVDKFEEEILNSIEEVLEELSLEEEDEEDE